MADSNTDTKPEKMTGSCLCGAVTYTITGSPFFSCICCCADCQRVSGGPFMHVLGVTADNFQLHNEEMALKSVSLNHAIAARGTPKSQSYCKDCGSVVFGGAYKEGPWHTVYAGTLDKEFKDVYPPTLAMFVKDRPKWAKIEGLEEYDGMPPMGAEDMQK